MLYDSMIRKAAQASDGGRTGHGEQVDSVRCSDSACSVNVLCEPQKLGREILEELRERGISRKHHAYGSRKLLILWVG